MSHKPTVTIVHSLAELCRPKATKEVSLASNIPSAKQLAESGHRVLTTLHAAASFK